MLQRSQLRELGATTTTGPVNLDSCLKRADTFDASIVEDSEESYKSPTEAFKVFDQSDQHDAQLHALSAQAAPAQVMSSELAGFSPTSTSRTPTKASSSPTVRRALASKAARRTFVPDPELSNASTEKQSPLDALIALQTFEGSWAWTAELFAVLGVSENDERLDLEALNRLIPRAPVDKTAAATALAIAYFEKKLSGDEEVWELVVEKARGWLEGKVRVEEANRLIEHVGGILA